MSGTLRMQQRVSGIFSLCFHLVAFSSSKTAVETAGTVRLLVRFWRGATGLALASGAGAGGDAAGGAYGWQCLTRVQADWT